MKSKPLSPQVSVSGQITVSDLTEIAGQGVQLIICNRPDGEAAGQPSFEEIKHAAGELGLVAMSIPFTAGKLHEETVARFNEALAGGLKTLAYCRTGNRSTQIWKASQAKYSGESGSESFSPAISFIAEDAKQAKPKFDVVIVGAGSGGVAASASLLKRDGRLRIALIDPSSKHYYQPGWTMVGGGVFSAESTERDTWSLIDRRVSLVEKRVIRIDAENDKVVLDGGGEVYYQQLILSPGLALDWGAIEGLEETLGKNGVTSNYRYDLAPYTWQLVNSTKKGKAIFTQPAMPIKCAGAPQKAMYLSADAWFKDGVLDDIDVEFCNAGGALFGVAAYVPALMEYIEKYGITLSFSQNLTRVDGENKQAWFDVADGDGNKAEVCKDFDMLHVCPPQCAPDFIAESGLADQGGWLDVDPFSLQHAKYKNVWGLGDVMNTSNAKTMAAVRKQVPVVAENLCLSLSGKEPKAEYDGYGSCPLTVERGKIVLAEFCYGGRVAPTFPKWMNNGLRPTRKAWWLKASVLPKVYWQAMLKGHEWLTKTSPEH